jgi:hypothetical protein
MAIVAPRRPSFLTATLVFAAALTVFCWTAYPTITWWDSSSYSLAAASLGVASPPGSLLLTLIGWPIAHLPFVDSPAHALNILAAVLAAATGAMLVRLATRMLRLARDGAAPSGALAAGAAFGALTFAFATTFWSYAGRFTPYILTPLFTVLILWTLVRWWEGAYRSDAWKWIALLGVLFGLDFSVHRTNALLIPGAVAWVAFRRPRALRDPAVVLAAIGGLALGLSVHLLLIPIARFTRSPLDFNHPASLAAFWDYVTIKQLGGSFLLQLFPRKAPIWSVQARDFLRVLGANFLVGSGHWSPLGALPAVASVVGLLALWRANARLAAAFVTLVATQAALTILYFNIPADYFRTFDRHYLPACLTLAVLMTCGAAEAARWSARLAVSGRRVVGAAMAGLVILLPAAQLAGHWREEDASRRSFARDYAADALRQLPPNAIYFTVGDNDTFPVLYMQSAEGARPDVTVINLSVANIPDWPGRLHRRDRALPLSLTLAERNAAAARTWTDSSLEVPVIGSAAQLGAPPGTKLPGSIELSVEPRYGTRMLPAEVVLLDIVRTNHWRRPLTFATTGTESAMEWLAPYGRLEGLYYRVVPLPHPAIDAAILRAHLLGRANYGAFGDTTVALDDVSRRIGSLYYVALQALLNADMERRDRDACTADRAALRAKLPPERLELSQDLRAAIDRACEAAEASR